MESKEQTQLCISRVDRLFSTRHAGVPVPIRQRWSGNEPQLTTFVSQIRQGQSEETSI